MDRGAGGDADVDARMAGLPGPALAERRGDRPVDRPDEAPAALDRAGREPPCAERICSSIFACCACSASMSSSMSCAWARTGRARACFSSRTRSIASRLPCTVTRTRATALRRSAICFGDPLLAVLELPEGSGRGGLLGLRVAHRRDDHSVLVSDSLQVFAVLDQVGEAVRVEGRRSRGPAGRPCRARRGGRPARVSPARALAAGSAGPGRAAGRPVCARARRASRRGRSWIASSRCWSVVIVPWSESILRVDIPEMSPVSTCARPLTWSSWLCFWSILFWSEPMMLASGLALETSGSATHRASRARTAIGSVLRSRMRGGRV